MEMHARMFKHEPEKQTRNPKPATMPVRTLKAKGGSVGTRGPWEPGRTGLTLTPQHERMLKWLGDEGFKIKV